MGVTGGVVTGGVVTGGVVAGGAVVGGAVTGGVVAGVVGAATGGVGISTGAGGVIATAPVSWPPPRARTPWPRVTGTRVTPWPRTVPAASSLALAWSRSLSITRGGSVSTTRAPYTWDVVGGREMVRGRLLVDVAEAEAGAEAEAATTVSVDAGTLTSLVATKPATARKHAETPSATASALLRGASTTFDTHQSHPSDRTWTTRCRTGRSCPASPRVPYA